MTTQDIGLLSAISAKMDYLAQRQRVIAENIANSDTPGYRPKDLKPVDFREVLSSVTGDEKVNINRTKSGHMSPNADVQDPKTAKQKDTYEVAPVGNAVIIEEQMLKSGQNTMDYNLMLNVYQKQIGMFRLALRGN